MGIRKLLALASVAASLGGCSAMPIALPDSSKLPERVLSKEEQQAKVNAMIAASKTHQSETAKGGVLVFRSMLRDAARDMPEEQLMNFNSFAPDFMFTIGDSEEGLQRMLASAGMAELAAPQKRGFIRWLLGR